MVEPHELPVEPAWLLSLRAAEILGSAAAEILGSAAVTVPGDVAVEIARYVDAIRAAAWPIVRALEDAGDQTN